MQDSCKIKYILERFLQDFAKFKNMNWYVKSFLTVITWYHFISDYLKIYIIIQNTWQHYNLLIPSTGYWVFNVGNCAIKFVSKILIKCRQSSFWTRTTVLGFPSHNRGKSLLQFWAKHNHLSQFACVSTFIILILRWFLLVFTSWARSSKSP